MISTERKPRESVISPCDVSVRGIKGSKLPLRRFRPGKITGMAFIFFFTLVLLTLFLFPIENRYMQGTGNATLMAYETASIRPAFYTDSVSPALLDKVRLLYLYTVKDGVVETTVISREDLQRYKSLQVDGYICGIMVFCEDEMNVSVGEEKMSNIKRNGDGTFSLKYFGKLKLEEIKATKVDKAYYEKALGEVISNRGNEKFLKGGYSLFPEVMGDSIVPEDQFRITFESQGKTFDLPVVQKGYYRLCTIGSAPQYQKDGLGFRYLGTRLNHLREETGDFDQRLSAIAQGVEFVERTFNVNLVETINIVDYKGIHNAVTCDGGKQVWFYTDAFVKEPVQELRAIAEHETLHKLVEKYELTKSPGIRELFADLKGYDDLAYERFLIITYGSLPPQGFDKGNTDHPFFTFINERNFLEGMKGGHSHANVAELCTSFLHSLLSIDRLGTNLDRPMAFPGQRGEPRLLSFEEKSVVMDSYVKTLELVMNSVSNGQRSSSLEDKTDAVLKECFQKASSTRNERRMAMKSVPPASHSL